MPRNGTQARATRELALDVRNKRLPCGLRRCKRARLAKQDMVDLQQPPWLLIGGAPHHDPIDAREMVGRLGKICDAAIEHDRQLGMRKLETKDAIVIGGGDRPGLSWT